MIRGISVTRISRFVFFFLVFVKMSSLYEKTNKQQTKPRPMQFAIFGVFSAFFISDSI